MERKITDDVQCDYEGQQDNKNVMHQHVKLMDQDVEGWEQAQEVLWSSGHENTCTEDLENQHCDDETLAGCFP